ncbi:hypothetical protein V8G54_023431 [Vigna mungo]|uniref:Uncharacterized protein n=1 Tax=Vigna mungo TaxID=3915 RepID=A0AAQ3N343_VIGMU
MTWRRRKLGQPAARVASPLSMTSTGSMFSSQKHQLGARSEWRCTERTRWLRRMAELRGEMKAAESKSTWLRLGKRWMSLPERRKFQSEIMRERRRRPWRLSQRLQTRELEFR